MIKSFDGTSYKRASSIGDRYPYTGFQRKRAIYTATGGETSIILSSLTPSISYYPGQNQITVKRSSTGATLISGVHYYESTSSSITFPSTTNLTSGEKVEIIQEFSPTGVVAAQLRPDVYTTVGTASQTLVSATFSWPYNLNPAYGQGGVEVFINGLLKTRGVDYTEVNLSTTNTNQITLLSALSGGEKITLIPAYEVIDQSAAATSYQGQQISQIQAEISAGTQAFIDTTSTIAVPNTAIINRANIVDISNNLKARMGIERIITQNLYLIQNEVGANGEKVWGVLNDQFGQIRFVGLGWNSSTQAGTANYGPFIQSGFVNDYVEITFYGTGLNLLQAFTGTTNVTIASYVDGSLSNSDILGRTTGSGIIGGNRFATNQVINVATGLTLGIHTVKLIITAQAGQSFNCYGFEILNQSSSVNVTPGTSYISGQKYITSSSQSFAYNSVVTGTKGGRVLVYQNSDGTIGQAFRACAASPSYTSSASHTNEDLARTYEILEFAAAGSADFSGVTSSSQNLGFTLDDGTTTLVGTGITNGPAFTSYIFTFIGTGLDLETSYIDFGSGDTPTGAGVIVIDGTTITSSFLPGAGTTTKIASGLPYGTHTLTWTNTNYSGVYPARFKVYQPKKPTLPQGSVELADYNVLANYVATSSAAIGTPATGIIRKMPSREFAYYGTWGFATDSSSPSHFDNALVGTTLLAVNTSAFVQYTFFGTGLEIGNYNTAANKNVTISIDGSSNLSSYTTNLIQPGGFTFTASTGVLVATPATAGRLRLQISGLTLGLHTIKIASNGANAWQMDTIDIITPIHSYKSNTYYEQQNALIVGSQAISDNRAITAVKEALPSQKAWAQAFGVQNGVSTTSTSFVPCPEMSVMIKVATASSIKISFWAIQQINTTTQTAQYAFQVDGVILAQPTIATNPNSANLLPVQLSARIPVSAGTHKVDVVWAISTGGTLSIYSNSRTLLVEEI